MGDLERCPESALKGGSIVLLADEKPLTLVTGLIDGEDPASWGAAGPAGEGGGFADPWAGDVGRAAR